MAEVIEIIKKGPITQNGNSQTIDKFNKDHFQRDLK